MEQRTGADTADGARPEPPFAAELETALAAAEAAAALVREAGVLAEFREKGRADLVTELDEAAERAVRRAIAARFPDDAVVGEELGPEAVHHGRRWYVDPVDGTTNLVHGHPYVAVSVAFADDDGPAAGVIHAPLLGEVYAASRGGGATLEGRPLRVSRVAEPSRALLATGFPFRAGKGDVDGYLRLVGDAIRATHGVRRAGAAALDLAYVAAGRVEAFFEVGLAPWDVAAGILLVEEAGGRVGGWPGDAEPPLHTGRIAASNGALHGWLDGLLARRVAEI